MVLTNKEFLEYIENNIFSFIKRLSEKTQVVFGITPHNVENRLIHSQLVAITAKNIANNLKLPEKLIDEVQIISLLHDIGHPFLGHEAEHILNEILKEKINKGFDANANNLVVLFKELELKKLEIDENIILGLIKYPQILNEDNEKGIYIDQFNLYIPKLLNIYIKNNPLEKETIKKILENTPYHENNELLEYLKENDCRLLSTKIMKEADRLTYLFHDIEDFLSYFDNPQETFFQIPEIKEYIKKYPDGYLAKEYEKEEPISISLLKFKKYIQNQLKFDGKNLEYSPEFEELLKTFNTINFKYYIDIVHETYSNKIPIKDILLKIFNNIDNVDFIKENIKSGTYQKLLLDNINNKDKCYLYLTNALTEMTDKWFLELAENLGFEIPTINQEQLKESIRTFSGFNSLNQPKTKEISLLKDT